MTREEINARIENIENSLFLLNMCDRWDSRDNERYYQLQHELRELQAL